RIVSATWFQSAAVAAVAPAGAGLAVVVVAFGAAVVAVVDPGVEPTGGAVTAGAAVLLVVGFSAAGAPVVVVEDCSSTEPATTGLLSFLPPRSSAMASLALLSPSELSVMRSRPVTCSVTMTPLAVRRAATAMARQRIMKA